MVGGGSAFAHFRKTPSLARQKYNENAYTCLICLLYNPGRQRRVIELVYKITCIGIKIDQLYKLYKFRPPRDTF